MVCDAADRQTTRPKIARRKNFIVKEHPSSALPEVYQRSECADYLGYVTDTKNWLDCGWAKFYSVPIFGKLLAPLANPVAGPQTIHGAARTAFFKPNSSQPARFALVKHPTPHALTEVRKTLD
jgi:hypothetical protein